MAEASGDPGAFLLGVSHMLWKKALTLQKSEESDTEGELSRVLAKNKKRSVGVYKSTDEKKL